MPWYSRRLPWTAYVSGYCASRLTQCSNMLHGGTGLARMEDLMDRVLSLMAFLAVLVGNIAISHVLNPTTVPPLAGLLFWCVTTGFAAGRFVAIAFHLGESR